VTNSSGLPLRYDYDEAGRIIAWRDRNGFGYQYLFDGDGQCVRTEGDDGYLTYTYEYDRENRVTRATNSLGDTTVFHLNDALQLAREIDPLGNETSFEWDQHHKPLAQTDSLGKHHQVPLRRGRQPRGTDPAGWHEAAHRVRRPAPTCGHRGSRWRGVASGIRAGGRTGRHGRSGGCPYRLPLRPGRAPRVGHRSAGQHHHGDQDARGLVSAVTDPNGARTEYGYDEMGRLASVTDPTGRTTRYGWTVEGLPATATPARRRDGTLDPRRRGQSARTARRVGKHHCRAGRQLRPAGRPDRGRRQPPGVRLRHRGCG